MDFKDWLLQEMPIGKMDFVGDWTPDAKRQYGYKPRDAKLLTNPRAQEKICRVWKQLPQTIHMCFVRTKDAYKKMNAGEVSETWVQGNLGLDIQADEDAITVLYTGNTDKTMTGWMLAHRMAHAFSRTSEFTRFTNEVLLAMQEILEDVYGISNKLYNSRGDRGDNSYSYKSEFEPQYTALSRAMGTMRSARDKSLIRPQEFFYEIVAQYVTQGKERFADYSLKNGSLKFNKLPSVLTWGRKAWGKPINSRYAHNAEAREEIDAQLESTLPDTLEYYLDEMFTSFLGRIFVM